MLSLWVSVNPSEGEGSSPFWHVMVVGLTVFLLVAAVKSHRLTLCEYLRAIGRANPHCESFHVDRPLTLPPPLTPRVPLPPRAPLPPLPHLPSFFTTPAPALPFVLPSQFSFTTPSTLARIIRTIETREAFRTSGLDETDWKTCARDSNKDCQRDFICPSGISCAQHETSKRCCYLRKRSLAMNGLNGVCPFGERPYGNCPVSGTICSSQDDCHSTVAPVCCDTGCGYSICVRANGKHLRSSEPLFPILLVPNSCPFPSQLKVKCRKDRAISWCSHDVHCQVPRSDGSITRHCCPTRCDYNVCITRDGDNYYIG